MCPPSSEMKVNGEGEGEGEAMVNHSSIKRVEIARALGISAAAVTKHVKAGMPTTGIAAARAWHLAHVDQVRSAGQRLYSVARMTAARPTAASPSVRQASPAAAPPGGVFAEFLRAALACGVVAEFLRAARACGHDEGLELPAPARAYLRALLRAMTPTQFMGLYWGPDFMGMVAVDWLLPAAFLEWSHAGPDDDCADDVPAEDMPLLQQLVAGQATFLWDPSAPWPTLPRLRCADAVVCT
jgi:hypothetical protein